MKMLMSLAVCAVAALFAANPACAADTAGDYSKDNARFVVAATALNATNVVFTNAFAEAWTPVAIVDQRLAGDITTNTYFLQYITGVTTTRVWTSTPSIGGQEVAQSVKDLVPVLRKKGDEWPVTGTRSNTTYTMFYRSALLTP